MKKLGWESTIGEPEEDTQLQAHEQFPEQERHQQREQRYGDKRQKESAYNSWIPDENFRDYTVKELRLIVHNSVYNLEG